MAKERWERILEILEVRGSVRVSELKNELNVSEVTLRSDIQKLHDRGLLMRTHGGAKKLESSLVVSLMPGNVFRESETKTRICEKAFDCIQEGNTVILDDSSTSYHLALQIKKHEEVHIVVVTNSIAVAAVLSTATNVTLFFAGGQITGNLAASMGDLALEAFKGFKVDKAFISAHGVDFEAGLSSIDSAHMQVKKAIIDAAKEVYLLVDSGKFGGGYVMSFCPIERISHIITDAELEETFIKEAKAKDIDLMLV